MKIAFRVDASIQIGTGHVMRCLTLANALTKKGHKCFFVCRDHNGHLGKLIKAKGFVLYLLPNTGKTISPDLLAGNSHAPWLGVSWEFDLNQTMNILRGQFVDWLVIDHYALDNYWEELASRVVKHILVIDDLADRQHHCDLLLDQTFGRKAGDYSLLLPASCEIICGSQYALLRPEFAALRSDSLERRTKPKLNNLLISMGGVDKDNVTGQILDALKNCELTNDCKIVVILGSTAPWLNFVKEQVKTLPWLVEVKSGVNNVAELMADSDLAIGAAGSTSWERCCLGIPTAMLVLAENQKFAAKLLEKAGAVKLMSLEGILQGELSNLINDIQTPSVYNQLSASAAALTNGKGCQYVINKMEGGINGL